MPKPRQIEYYSPVSYSVSTDFPSWVRTYSHSGKLGLHRFRGSVRFGVGRGAVLTGTSKRKLVTTTNGRAGVGCVRAVTCWAVTLHMDRSPVNRNIRLLSTCESTVTAEKCGCN